MVKKNSLDSNTTASNNTAVGYDALQANTTGADNTAVGSQAGDAITTGASNTLLGRNAGGAITTGNNNVAIGDVALDANTTASNNTAVGYEALTANTTGTQNTAVGKTAGNNVTTGSGNTLVGYLAKTSASNGENQIVIGKSVTGNGDNKISMGSSSGYIWNSYTVNATWTQVSDERTKKNIKSDDLGLAFINELRPVTFNWKAVDEIDPAFIEQSENIGRGDKDTETIIHGLIAQEVKEAMDKVGNSTFNGWEEGQDGQAISREMFITPLIKAVQELSAQVEELKQQLNTEE